MSLLCEPGRANPNSRRGLGLGAGYRLLLGRPVPRDLPREMKIPVRNTRLLSVLPGVRLRGKPRVGEGFERVPGCRLLDRSKPRRVLTIWLAFKVLERLPA